MILENFRNRLSKIFAKMTGKISEDSLQSIPLPQAPPSEMHSLQRKCDSVTPKNKDRDPYFFQIGFDFGTSYSKAVVRDINRNHAWVYVVPFGTKFPDFLIPTVVVYKNGMFERHVDTGLLYPGGGLYHLKMALEKAALGKQDAPIFSEYKRILGNNSPNNPVQIAKLAVIYFLSTTFSEIIHSIKQKFPDYGAMQEDQIAVNMAIPVANISTKSVCQLFESVLNIAWKLGQEDDFIHNHLSVSDLLLKVRDLKKMIQKEGNNELCHVYPEVSANVQAFLRSPASSPDVSTIYFLSDTGAGTVDQSVFTYAGKNGRKLNYFSAHVFPIGSSLIERIACGDETNETNLEYWRKKKESGSNDQRIKSAKEKVGKKVKTDSEKSLHDTQKCLWLKDSLERNIKFIFSGGGHIKFPYQNAVIEAYQKYLDTKRPPIVTSMPRPNDLDIPKGHEHRMNRLYVAYGLAFLFAELQGWTSPSENIISDETISNPPPKNREIKYCLCKGLLPECPSCHGSGQILEL